MEKTYETTTYKLKELWSIVSQLTAQIEDINKKLSALSPDFQAIWSRINAPTYTPKNNIDVKATYLLEADAEGNVVLDELGQPKKCALYSVDSTKTNVVWDKDKKCWRFYAIYADGE